jgi:hypothetical protein
MREEGVDYRDASVCAGGEASPSAQAMVRSGTLAASTARGMKLP